MIGQNAKGRLGGNPAGKRGYGDNGRWVMYWVHLGWWISPRYSTYFLGRGLKFWTVYFRNFPKKFLDCVNSRIGGTGITESIDTGLPLHFKKIQHCDRRKQFVRLESNINSPLLRIMGKWFPGDYLRCSTLPCTWQCSRAAVIWGSRSPSQSRAGARLCCAAVSSLPPHRRCCLAEGRTCTSPHSQSYPRNQKHDTWGFVSSVTELLTLRPKPAFKCAETHRASLGSS